MRSQCHAWKGGDFKEFLSCFFSISGLSVPHEEFSLQRFNSFLPKKNLGCTLSALKNRTIINYVLDAQEDIINNYEIISSP